MLVAGWLRAGTYSNAGSGGGCEACATGKYSTAEAATSSSTCQECEAGYYQAENASTTCHACSWAWEPRPWATTSESAVEASGCQCKAGQTGSGDGLLQHAPSNRPVYSPYGGRLTAGSVNFTRSSLHFLHSRARTWKIHSNGGLTIVAEVKFSGAAGMHERIIDFGNGIGRYDDSFLLSRWKTSSRLYAALTEQVRCRLHMHASWRRGQCNKHWIYLQWTCAGIAPSLPLLACSHVACLPSDACLTLRDHS